MTTIGHWWLSLLLLIVTGETAFAQPIYRWKDEKGQWHFSNVSPPGVAGTKIIESNSNPTEMPLSTPSASPDISSSSGNEDQDKAVPKVSSSSEVSLKSSDRRWLLIFPPITPARMANSQRFSGWTPQQFFDSDKACNLHKALLINSLGFPVNFELLNSECIPAFDFVIGKEPDVIIVAAEFQPVAPGFSSYLVAGKVFNRGQTAARNVVTKYRIQNADGVIITQGEVPTSPDQMPGLSFAEFRSPSIGGMELDGLSVHAEAHWSKK